MLLDLKFSIGTLGLGAGTFIAALYGMNLTNFLEESSIGFGAISLACTALTFAVCLYAMKRLRRVQRIKMWGETGSHYHHYLSSSGHHNHQSYTSLTPTSRALETPVTAALVGKNGGVAAAIAEKKAERMKSARKAAAAAAAAASAAAARRASLSASSAASTVGSNADENSHVRDRGSARIPAFGPRYGDPYSRLGNKKPSKESKPGMDSDNSTARGAESSEHKGAGFVLSSGKAE